MFKVGSKVVHRRLRLSGEIVSINERRALVRVPRPDHGDTAFSVLAWSKKDLLAKRAA